MTITLRKCMVTGMFQSIHRDPLKDRWFTDLTRLKRNFVFSHGIHPSFVNHYERWMLGEIKVLTIDIHKARTIIMLREKGEQRR